MKNIYFTYRPTFTNRGVLYDPSYFNDQMFADFKQGGLTNMVDGARFIPEDRITEETVPGVKTLRRAGVLEYNDAYVDVNIITEDLLRTTNNFLLKVKTAEEMKEWIRENTDLEELEDGKFQTMVADEETLIEARFISIN